VISGCSEREFDAGVRFWREPGPAWLAAERSVAVVAGPVSNHLLGFLHHLLCFSCVLDLIHYPLALHHEGSPIRFFPCRQRSEEIRLNLPKVS